MKAKKDISKCFSILADNNFQKVFLKSLKAFFTVFLIIGFFIFTTGVVYVVQIMNDDVEYDVKASKMHLSSIIYALDENGDFKEQTRAYDIENRIWVNFEDIPKNMKNAVIAIEDKRFYEHSGVDWKRTF